MIEALLWRACRGLLAGLAAFGAISHAILQAGGAVGPWWLPACLLAGLGLGLRWRTEPPPPGARPPRWLPPAVLVVLGAIFAVLVWGATATPPREWDGIVSWRLRAAAMFEDPNLGHPIFADARVYAPGRDYPLLQPLAIASLGRLLGDLNSGQVLLPLLWALLVTTVTLALRRMGVHRDLSWPMAVAFGATPLLIEPSAGGVDSGYGELTLLVFSSATAAGLALRDPLLLACGAFLLPLAKPEGLPYGLLVLAAAWWTGSRRLVLAAGLGWTAGLLAWLPISLRLLGSTPPFGALLAGPALVLVAALATTRRRGAGILLATAGVATAAWIGPELAARGGVLGDYASGLSRAVERLGRLPEIGVALGAHMAHVRRFGLGFVLLVVVAVLPRRHRGPCPAPALGLLIALAAPAIVLPFLLSPETDLRHHVRSSMDRLLLHWIGPCWLLAGPWVAQALGRRTPDRVSGRA